jgi:phenylpropionate dioxygenase-like ring-hydroxylating dioxygenase large terminal subunit
VLEACSLFLEEDELDVLPNDWYTTSEAFEIERRAIIERSWQYVGAAGLADRPGHYFTDDVGAMPVVVACDDDGELNAMVNVCQHRGAVVADGRGHCNFFKCPNHGWTYNLDGSLKSTLGMREPVDAASHRLPRLQAQKWGPFAFVAPEEVEPLETFFGPLHERCSALGLEWDDLRMWDHRTYDIAANWKVVVENYIECYHCGHVHPDYAKYVDLGNYYWETGEYYEAQGGPAHDLSYKTGYMRRDMDLHDGLFVHVWPNFHLQVYPGDHNISALQIRPVSPTRTLAVLDHYMGPNVTEQEADRITEMFDQQLSEDWVICERVQRGLDSGQYRPGRQHSSGYTPATLNFDAEPGKTEDAIRHFHRLMHRALSRKYDLSYQGNGNGR